MKIRLPFYAITAVCLLALFIRCSTPPVPPDEKLSTYDQLVSFFSEWRTFQQPIMVDGTPDYSESAMKKQLGELANWQNRLHSFDTTGWPIKHQIDWYLMWAEMNGLDFDHHVLQPWVRDPAFYVWFFSYPSDVPAREAPHVFGAVELPVYKQPFSEKDATEIATRLRKAKAVFEQAKLNLTGNAKDLWVTGIRSVREQSDDLAGFAKSIEATYPDLAAAAIEAKTASDEFATWLGSKATSKTGPSGIGIENYDWYVRNVHLTTYTWHDEKILLERELARSHSALRLMEHQNRKLPKLEKANSADTYQKLLTEGVNEFMDFFEKEEFITVKPYMKPALMAQIQPYVPSDSLRGFFDEIDHRDPMPMRSHQFHWIEKEREIVEPVESPIRRAPLLYNIYDSRAEGLATAMEELVMNVGLLENRPRARELVYIMLAQRAARGLGGIYQHANQMTFDEATRFASKWVPWGLAPAGGGTLQHEEQFYLEQPGYGSSYVMGKLDIDKLIAEYARQREGKFNLREFMDEFTTLGIIPTSLLYWQMTGSKELVNEAVGIRNEFD
jgi:hypothetical protein